MADVLGGGSSLNRQYLPLGAVDGQYVKFVDGKATWAAETPGGVVTEAGANAANAVGAGTGATTALKLANLTTYATDAQQGVVELATQAEASAGTDTTKVLTPKTFAGALEAGQVITTTLAVDGGFAATNFGSTEAISGGTANG